MKKILLLGGSAQQIVAIETAKKMGLYTVLCDYLPDNPGQYAADKFYLVSTTDKEAVLKVAQEERVDGVLAYASDPAAPTAAYVAEKMGLPGNPYSSVEILCNKDKFRKFLKENGFPAPLARSYTERKTAIRDLTASKDPFPLIVKPVDSSGSKGITVLKTEKQIEQAVEGAFSFSRKKCIIAEDYIEKKHPYLIGGDIFAVNGKVILWGLMNCHRDIQVNPLVPTGKSYPPQLESADLDRLKDTLQNLVSKLHFQNGAINIEAVLDKDGRVWLLDVGPRNGGNMIPDLLGYIFKTDVVKMSVQAAMGNTIENNMKKPECFWATHNLHSAKAGTYLGIQYSREIEPYIVKECIYKKQGDPVEYFDHAAKAVGILFLKFPDEQRMRQILEEINRHVQVMVAP